MATLFHAGSSGAPVKVLIVLPIISLLPGGGGGRWPSMPFLLWSRHGKVSHTPSSLVKDLLLPGHSFPIWNDRLRAGPTDTLCTGWLWWQQASPNQCPLSPGSDEPRGGWWSRLSGLFCLHLPALRYPSPHLSRLDKETTGRDGDRSAALKITLALPFPHQMQMGTPAHYTP